MSYQIIKRLRAEDGEILCQMCSNNVRPHSYYPWARPDNQETRQMVRGFLLDRVWQPTNRDTRFIRELGLKFNPNIYAYEEGMMQ